MGEMGGAKFQCRGSEGEGKNIAHKFRGGGQILSACDFHIGTAPPPAVNNDHPLSKLSPLMIQGGIGKKSYFLNYTWGSWVEWSGSATQIRGKWGCQVL